ncbi:substrate-binding domain-containing protein [Paenibacillus bovis]|uniref:Transcriptional regulator n=1 Tax=Paenibacillus bovis TaxID=1616788 RepID=A0A172ZGB8_9BACL|nr:substrate-binding domain-containing protein [Paenibacillus bovis]ANF96695.1 transcriptional regulator [Paenibacillus bovis]
MNKNITMRDIALKMGVSSVTVSKALNDKDGVSDELKEKIKLAAWEMGYRMNTVAKSMREGLTYNLGVIIPERFTGTSQTFYLRLYQEIAVALQQHNYYGILHILSREDEEQLHLPRIYHEQKVDGFILLGQVSKEYIEVIEQIEQPKMFLDFYDEHAEIDSIITDNFYGAYELTNYLIRQGHRDIAYVGNLYSTSSIQDRFLGYYKSLLEHHLPLRQEWILSDRDEQGTFVDLELPSSLPTAFVCNCDQVAHLLLQQLRAEGYQVPQDCSVVGFDNDIYATLSEPHLTTIEVNINKMAYTAVDSILKKIRDPHTSFGRVLVPGNIIYRDSVKDMT